MQKVMKIVNKCNERREKRDLSFFLPLTATATGRDGGARFVSVAVNGFDKAATATKRKTGTPFSVAVVARQFGGKSLNLSL